jgi:hypothetical protein
VRQTNFSAGELDPLLWGRTDLPAYARGMRRMRNFFPSKQGAAVSRPGSTFIGFAESALWDAITAELASLGDDVGRTRLLRFDAGDADHNSYVLHFGEGYVRFITDGAFVLDGGGNPYEVATPYSHTELWELQTAQLGDVVIIAHPNHAPQQLRRNAHADWTLTDFSFKAYEPFATDVGDPNTPTSGLAVVKPPDWEGTADYVVGNLVTHDANIYECITAGTSAGAGGPTGGDQDIVDGTVHWKFISAASVPDEDHIAQEWQWMWTTIVKDNETGALYETLGEMVSFEFDGFVFDGADGTSQLLSSDKWPVYPDMPVILRRAETLGLISPPDGSDTYVVQEYLVYRGRGGCFGWVGSTKSREFVDKGEDPNYAIQPPAGTEPFDAETGYPRAVAFFGTRLLFAGPTKAGGDVYASKVNDFQNWDVRKYKHIATEAVQYELALQRREDVLSMVAAGRLVMLTGSTAWSALFEPPQFEGQPVGFDPVPAEKVGATTLQPLEVKGTVFYARTKGRGVVALVPTGQADTPYAGVDVSALAQHLFTGADKDLVDWCYAEDPWGLVWAVRGDGALLSFTFLKDHWGWAHHETDGFVESICSVPEENEDAVYIVVRRMTGSGATRRYVERMTSRVRYDGPVVDGADVEVPADFICLDSALEYFGDPVQVISGLEHLEGKQVWVIGPDMDPRGTFAVSGGEVDLGDVLAGNVNTSLGLKLLCYVGLPFTPELESLDVAGGELRLKKKIVERIGFEADNSIGLEVGQDFDHLDEWEQRDVEDGFGAVSASTVLVDMPVDGEWNQTARMALRQSMPLPVTIVGLTRELGFGE